MGKKILVIDDNKQDRMIMKLFLTRAGYEEVSTAESGEEGVEKAVSEKPDLVVTDTILPGIDGFEVCKRIKESKISSEARVIILTGTIDAVDAVKARKMGADDYCVKTAGGVSLVTAVKNLLK
jgi:two-component system alkaline phosphatase synthesis response regulator PhoP